MGNSLQSKVDHGGIRTSGLCRKFGTANAVDGIDLSVDPGEIYGFLGPNGAGKSTTVLMLATLLPPTSGRAEIAGHDVVAEARDVRSVIGATLQEVALDPLLTAKEHLRLQAALQGISRRAGVQRGDELLDLMGLTDAGDRRVGALSGGMRRRLDLALALLHQPRVLFLDEPSAGLDVPSRAALWHEVSRLATEQMMTVFLTTQYLEEADQLASRVGIIDRGRIVAEGRPSALKAEIGQSTVEIRPSSPSDRLAAGPVLARFGEQVAAAPDSFAVRLRSGDRDLGEVLRALDGLPFQC